MKGEEQALRLPEKWDSDYQRATLTGLGSQHFPGGDPDLFENRIRDIEGGENQQA